MKEIETEGYITSKKGVEERIYIGESESKGNFEIARLKQESGADAQHHICARDDM
jgi:hypothetical protein